MNHNQKSNKHSIEELVKYKALSEASEEAIFFSDNGYCIECNKAVYQMFGYTNEEVIGLFATDIIAPESQELVEVNLKNEYPHPYTVKAKRKDGSTFWAEIHGKMIDYKGKNVRLSNFRDISVQKEAEKAVVEMDLKYQLLFQNMSEAFSMQKIVYTEDGTIDDLIYIDINPAFEKLVKKKKEEIIGHSIKTVWQNLDVNIWERYNSIITENKIVQFDFYNQLLNKYLEVKVHQPQKGYIAQTYIDITEKKTALTALEYHNNRLKLLVYFSEIAAENYKQLLETIVQEAIRFVNCSYGACVVIYNGKIEDSIYIENQNTNSLFDISKWYSNISQADRTEAKILDSENHIKIASIPIIRNEKIQLHFVIGGKQESLIDSNDLKHLKLLFESCWSILERQKYEEQILAERKKAKLSEYRFAEIQKAGKIGWYEAQIKEGSFLGSYEAYNIFFDSYWDKPATPDDLMNAIHPDDREHFFNVVQENIKNKSKFFDWEYRVITPKSGLKYIFSRAYLEFNSQGEHVRRFGIVQDITKIKKYEEQLIQAKEKAIESDRLKSAFLANMSHEIRTPMNGIIGFSELLMIDDISAEKKINYAQIVIDSGKHLLNIVDDILDISKIEVGQLNIVFEPVTVNEIIREVSLFFDHKTKETNIKLQASVGLSDNESIICSDKFRLVQILNNLISNAFKFTKEGVIEFGYKSRQSHLEFFVKDTGIGIPEEFHEAVFDRFRQSDQDIVRQVGGTGLGLAITKKLVELLGGEIRLESIESEGSSFYFTLPFEQVEIKENE